MDRLNALVNQRPNLVPMQDEMCVGAMDISIIETGDKPPTK